MKFTFNKLPITHINTHTYVTCSHISFCKHSCVHCLPLNNKSASVASYESEMVIKSVELLKCPPQLLRDQNQSSLLIGSGNVIRMSWLPYWIWPKMVCAKCFVNANTAILLTDCISRWVTQAFGPNYTWNNITGLIFFFSPVTWSCISLKTDTYEDSLLKTPHR